MALHKPFDRSFFLLGGATMTNGRSLNLAKGQFGIFDSLDTNKDGTKAVSTFNGQPRNNKYRLQLGVADQRVTRSKSNKPMSSFPFSLSGVQNLTVSVPNRTEQSVDEVLVGYNGINDNTSLKFKKGQTSKLYVELSGEPIGMLGYDSNSVTIPVYMDTEGCSPLKTCEDCDPCEEVDALPVALKGIEILRDHKLRGNVPVTDFIEISPIRECETNPVVEEIGYTFYSLRVADTGDSNALALVQTQYENAKVSRTGRKDATSTYEILVPTADGAPANFVQSISGIIKGCEDCPSGYTAEEGAIIYAVTLEDDGADRTADIEAAFDNLVPGSVVKSTAQKNGVGYYTVVVSQKIDQAELAGIVSDLPTVTVTFVGESDSICNNDTETTISWIVGEECQVSTESYSITLPDNDCGQDRLAELQRAFPSYTISVADSDQSKSDVTLTGTSGTANININGTDYLATFDTDLATTAANFVSANAATILTNNGLTVTSEGAVISFVGDTEGFNAPTIANATTDLSGTVSTAAILAKGGCQTKYTTSVETNMVCEECDPIFKDYFSSKAPSGSYDTREWVKDVVPGSESTNCKVGIRIKGRVLEVHPEEHLRDQLGFVDNSVKVRVSGGYTTEVREGIGSTEDTPFAVEYKSRYERRTHLGGNLFNDEDRNRQFFLGEARHYGDNVAKLLLGEESVMRSDEQRVDYALTLRRDHYSQSFGGRSEDNITYHILVEVGRHEEVEAILNNLAQAAGLEPVKAYGA